jgi:8-oxo-dGTP pyrophosphatase MutT (NUDIX family)
VSPPAEALAKKYGPPQHVMLSLPSILFPPVSERRHGEVCMAILRRNGRFLLQTKRSYPNSVMRLPSGGIKAGEDIEHALLREVWEETNLTVNVDRFVAILRYRDDTTKAGFQTFLFLLREIEGHLQTNDPSEKITEWREARPDELLDYAAELKQLEPSWANWGLFRAASLDVLAEYCSNTSI